MACKTLSTFLCDLPDGLFDSWRVPADAPVMANGALSPPASDQHSTPKAHVDPNDPIYQAMIAAAKAGPGIGTAHKRQASATPDIGLTPPHTGASPLRSPTHQGGALAARGAPSGPPPAKKPRVLAAFGGEDEEERPKRRLIPLQYRWTASRHLVHAAVLCFVLHVLACGV